MSYIAAHKAPQIAHNIKNYFLNIYFIFFTLNKYLKNRLG